MTALDRHSPVPLYHQLAEALRYRIATGVIQPRATLPSLRRASALWGLNLHTVRKAYAELERLRLVATHTRRGTVVRPQSETEADRATSLQGFLNRTLAEAREEWGLTSQELINLLRQTRRASPGEPVWVVECSASQAADLADQLVERWAVDARPWSLDQPGEPPEGLLLVSLFHTNDVRSRWPSRFSEARFVAIHPDPDLADQLPAALKAAFRVAVVERDAQMATNIAADLGAILPSKRFLIETHVVEGPAEAFDSEYDFLLFAPRIWGSLDDAMRSDARAFEVRYRWESRDLGRLADELDWALADSPSPEARRPIVLGGRAAQGSSQIDGPVGPAMARRATLNQGQT
ncbi:MAG: GntR family transcriptional regulator [Gemmatimonadota bacterium]